MGNNSDIKIRVRWDLYEKCRFENVNDDEGDESRCGAVRNNSRRVTSFRSSTRTAVDKEAQVRGQVHQAISHQTQTSTFNVIDWPEENFSLTRI